MTTAGKAGFITALYIILVPSWAISWATKSWWIIVICVTLAIAGFYLLCINGDFRFLRRLPGPLLCRLLRPAHPGSSTISSKKANSIKLSWVQFATAFSSLLRYADGPLRASDWSALWAAKWPLLYAGGLSSGVAYTLQIVGQKYTEPTTATLIMSLESVFAALAGWLILGRSHDGQRTDRLRPRLRRRHLSTDSPCHISLSVKRIKLYFKI